MLTSPESIFQDFLKKNHSKLYLEISHKNTLAFILGRIYPGFLIRISIEEILKSRKYLDKFPLDSAD